MKTFARTSIARNAVLAVLTVATLLTGAGSASASPADPEAATAVVAESTDDLTIEINPGLWPDFPITWLNLKPYYNDYIQCVGSWMYTDFVDPDGNDALQTVTLAAYKNGVWQYRTMDVSNGHHGVFFYLERNAAGVNGASHYYLRSRDVRGAYSPWTYISGDCNGTQI